MTTRITGGGRRSSRNEEGTSTSNSGKRVPFPPSRHLWVGNLAEGVSEEELSFEFSRFGVLDSVAFQPGRSYAFVNFKEHDDAIAAINYLQNRYLAGNPLRIEFAKLEKPSAAAGKDRDHMKYQENLRSSSRLSPFSQRTRESSVEQFYPERSNSGERGGEPSEVLWIGFPALLKVDELILKKAFSPFGDIEKITAFPGRSYAFVRFRSINSAYKAKETLQGKLFGNPRVHICFAKSENGASASHFKSKTHSDHFSNDNYPHLYQNNDFDDSSAYSNNFVSIDLDRRSRDHFGDHVNDHSSRLRRGKDVVYEEQWDLPDDSFYLHESKRLRTSSSQIPEYLLNEPNKERYQYRREIPEKNDGFIQRSLPYGDMNEQWKTSDEFHSDERKRLSPDPRHSSMKLWKWEGTIAKGGSPVCRAHCLPVGNPMNFMLPDMVDCTARTGLDMLAKHYYQATCAWVVFFVPDDADIEYYNEFMHYLEEKQRAAVAKLNDKTTLFLVPPSEFSEKVLKVPGKLSISGVALRVENEPRPMERRDAAVTRSSYDSRPVMSSTMSPAAFPGVNSSAVRVTDDPYFEELWRKNSGHRIDPNNAEANASWASSAAGGNAMGTDAYAQNHARVSEADKQKVMSANADADPQKSLEATLQLAAVLLQQIQQGKGT